ncbi:MAG: START domain-containing protein [Bacteroidales bacterium]|nr:START domain-containing protein [Bacteroidales bacterium]
MRKPLLLLFITFYIQLFVIEDIYSQAWDFVKEKDGIKIYTRKEGNASLKQFKGVADIYAPMEKVCELVGNVKNTDWWDKNLEEINVLLYEKDKHIQYYLVYGVPWPLTDRDLCVDAKITTDPGTGVRIIYSTPLFNVVPERSDRVRIKEYWQRWTLQPVTSGCVHVILEGYVDPGGNVPDWLYNMVITDTPLKVIRGIKGRLEPKSIKTN